MIRLAAGALVLCLLVPFAGVAHAQQATGPSPDRIVAEWMVRMGGSVVLTGQRKPIYDLADLPTTDFRIHALNFTGITMYAASLGRTAPPAGTAAPERAVHQRTAVVRPACAARGRYHLAVQGSDIARKARAQQAGSNLYPAQRSGAAGPVHVEELEGSARPSDAELWDFAQAVSADAPRPQLCGHLQRHRHGQLEGHEDAHQAVPARHDHN